MTRVAMYPAVARRNDNPFVEILARGLRDAGAEVRHVALWRPVPEADVLHVHWLEQVFWGKLAKRFPVVPRWRARRLIHLASAFNRTGRSVVWTVHNLRPHAELQPRQQAVWNSLRNGLLPLVTDVVLMNRGAEQAVRQEYPEVAGARFHVVPHPHYREFFEGLRPFRDLRRQYGIATDVPLFVVVGKIRPYKRIPELVRTLRQARGDFVVYVGGTATPATRAELRTCIGDDRRFILDVRHLSHHDVASIFASANAAVFGFRDVLNSGSVLAALSMSTPVIVPRLGAFSAIEDTLGNSWVHTYQGALTRAGFEALLPLIGATRRDDCPIDAFAPARVGRQLLLAYAAGGPHRPAPAVNLP